MWPRWGAALADRHLPRSRIPRRERTRHDDRAGMTTENELTVRTDRLLLRRWRDDDVAPFAAMNADPAVMEHFVSTLSSDETAGFVHRIERSFEQRGYGLWAVEVPGVAPFIGFV